ncbi:MAG: Demethylmenaquinone methyltransferase [Syntrophus sp. PtaU1.Bin005]|nr:MAG: Demethylmenaquinone methyltransferase [Syntrophus sp. PtaU1.Bin005]
MKERLKRDYAPVKNLKADDHIRIVQDIFATVTGKYDFLNHLLSFRRDVAWRRFAARKMHFPRTRRYLDVATGTADLALEVASRYPDVEVTGVDFVLEMLGKAVMKTARRKECRNRVSFVQGDALALPFADRSFDVVGIAFGIRNIPDRPGALREFSRVLIEGGQVAILEMQLPQQKVLQLLCSFYLRRILPRMARCFTRNPAAYLYLADSIIQFPAPERFAGMIRDAGFSNVRHYPLTLGITRLYVGTKPDCSLPPEKQPGHFPEKNSDRGSL